MAKIVDDLKLHLGCGPRILDGWLNIDKKKINPQVLAMELPKGLKEFDDNSVHYIYASHFLEHLEYPKKALNFVRQCYRLLIPSGVLRIVVPGIDKIIEAYVRNDEDFFTIQETMHPSWCTTKLEHLMYALQQDGEHKYGYDFETMKKLLTQGGFSNIIKSDYNKSYIEDLRIDYRSEIDNKGEYLSLYVDAVK